MSLPLVTVCVPTYNKAPFLQQSLVSLLAQTFTDFLLIVVDDRSTDFTAEVVSSLKDPRVRYVINPANLGLTRNWNKCVEVALKEQTPYVAIYHDDDLYAPAILEREITFLEKNPEVGLVHTAQFYYRQEEDCYTLRRPYPADRVMTAYDLLEDLCERQLYHITTPSVMARREAYVKAGGFDPTFTICPDLDLWWRMLEHYRMGYLAEPLITVRVHQRQVSSSPMATENATRQHELRLVLSRALTRLEASDPTKDWERIAERVDKYCAQRILEAAKDHLLAGRKEGVRDACREALKLDRAFKTWCGAVLLRGMNNRIGRTIIAKAVAGIRMVRSKGAQRCA